MATSTRAFLKLDLSDQGLEGLEAVDLKDIYCSNPECDCGGAFLYPSRFIGRSSLDQWAESSKGIQFHVNVQTGDFETKGPESPLRQALQTALKRSLDKRRLARLRKARMGVLRQHADEGWRFRDWSDFEPGWLMSWADLFPESLAWSIQTSDGLFFLHDNYCCTFGCKCTEMRLQFFLHGPPTEACGSVTYDYQNGQATLEPEGGFSPKILQEIFNGFLKLHPDLKAELRRRCEFMAGPVATFLHESVPQRPSKASSKHHSLRERTTQIATPPEFVLQLGATPSAKVGRNEPCPCGSGRKSKKCCQAS